MLEFNEEKHRYSWEGRPVVSVTQALQSAGLIDPTYYNEQALIRGTMVHRATQLLDEDDLDQKTLHSKILPYLFAYQRAKRELAFVPKLVEQRVFNPDWFYAGTLDRTGTLFTGTERQEKIILDIKTGSVEAWARVQVAAYLAALVKSNPAEFTGHRRYVLELRPNETYKLHGPYIDRNDFKIFCNCISIANWKLANKLDRLAA